MKPRACKHCKKPMTPREGPGRPREYCGPACGKAHLARVRAAERAELRAFRAQARPTAPEVSR